MEAIVPLPSSHSPAKKGILSNHQTTLHQSPHRHNHPSVALSTSSSSSSSASSSTSSSTGVVVSSSSKDNDDDKQSVISELQPEIEEWHESEKARNERLAYEQFIKEEAEKAAAEEVRVFLKGSGEIGYESSFFGIVVGKNTGEVSVFRNRVYDIHTLLGIIR